MSYNLTLLTSATEKSIGMLVCQSNQIANEFPAYVLLILVFFVSLTIILQRGRTLYSALPVCFFITSLISIIFVTIRCSNKGMIPLWLVFTLWGATALFTGLRIIIKRD